MGLAAKVDRRVSARRTVALVVMLGFGGIAASVAYATSAATGIPGPDGVFHACANNVSGDLRLVPEGKQCTPGWSSVSWSQTGPSGPPGPQGPQGPAGSGSSDAFSAQAGNEVTVPVLTPTTLLTLDGLPEGNYAISAAVVLHNLDSRDTTPVLCQLVTSGGASLTYSARIDPFTWQGLGAPSGASTMTIPLSLTTQLPGNSSVSLQCYSNHTSPTATALAGSRQITAIRVGTLVQK